MAEQQPHRQSSRPPEAGNRQRDRERHRDTMQAERTPGYSKKLSLTKIEPCGLLDKETILTML